MAVVNSRKELIAKILKEEKLCPGDKISLTQLKDLATKYSISPYTMAIAILGATQAQYNAVNFSSSHAHSFVILKQLVPELIQKAQAKRNIITENEHLEKGNKITYQQLKDLALKYDIPEKILAIYVLNIPDSSYRKIKNGINVQATILNNQNETKQEEKTLKDLRNKIIQGENLKYGSKINYEQLQKIAIKYNLDEHFLAFTIFCLTDASYRHIKQDKNRHAIILKNYFTIEQLKNLSQKILQVEKITLKTPITYQMLSDLSQKYFFTEKIIAVDILGLSENQYCLLKYDYLFQTYIPTYQQNYTLKQKQKEIFDQEKIKVGDTISYNQIATLMAKYDIALEDILDILGISQPAYYFIKSHKNAKSVIKDKEKLNTIMFLKDILEKERYYSKEELAEICQVNNLSITEFIDYYFGNAQYFGHDDYQKVLEEKGKIWLGKRGRLSSDFINNNAEGLRRIAQKISEYIYYKYKNIDKSLEKEDLESEALALIMEKCHDLQMNFAGLELSRMIYLRVRIYMLEYLDLKQIKTDYLKDNIKDFKTDTVVEALKKLSIPDYIFDLLEQGYDSATILKAAAKNFNVTKKEILLTLKEYLTQKKSQNSKVKR